MIACVSHDSYIHGRISHHASHIHDTHACQHTCSHDRLDCHQQFTSDTRIHGGTGERARTGYGYMYMTARVMTRDIQWTCHMIRDTRDTCTCTNHSDEHAHRYMSMPTPCPQPCMRDLLPWFTPHLCCRYEQYECDEHRDDSAFLHFIPV